MKEVICDICGSCEEGSTDELKQSGWDLSFEGSEFCAECAEAI